MKILINFIMVIILIPFVIVPKNFTLIKIINAALLI